MTLLVTGWTGLIGRAVAARLAGRPARLLARGVGCTPPGAEVIVGDVRDRATLVRALRDVDAVLHLAGQTSYRVAAADPDADRAVNVDAVRAIVEASAADGVVRTLVLAGSESQAGQPATVPLDESHPDAPLTAYDAHKLEAEQLATGSAAVRGVGLRMPTVYGPGPRERSGDRGVVGTVIRRALTGRPVQVYGSGAWRRDLLHVEDAAVALLTAVDNAVTLAGRHWLVGTAVGITVRTAISDIAAATGVGVEHVAPPPGWSAIDERDVVVDPARFAAATGWSARIPWHEGMRVTIEAIASGQEE